MFELMFGTIWTAIIALITFAFYGGLGGEGSITVNGVPVSQAEFNMMLWPKIFIGIFWVVGIIFLFKGFKKLFANMATKVNGRETIGCVVDILDSGCRVNNRTVYNIKVLIDNNGSFEEYVESSGMDYNKYPIGSYIKVKYYKKDINILGTAREYDAPLRLRDYVDSHHLAKSDIGPRIDIGDNEVFIDGVRYVKSTDNSENNFDNKQNEKSNNHFDV